MTSVCMRICGSTFGDCFVNRFLSRRMLGSSSTASTPNFSRGWVHFGYIFMVECFFYMTTMFDAPALKILYEWRLSR